MKQVLIFFIYILISTASLFPNEFSLISYLDIANPKFTDNPASIALMSGININYDLPTAYSSKNSSRHKNYYNDLYEEQDSSNGIYDVTFEKENTTMLSGKLGMNNYGISYKKQTSKFENDLKNISHDRNIKEEEIFKESVGFIFGKRLGRLLVGLHNEKIFFSTKINTESSDFKAPIRYYTGGIFFKQTYGFMLPIAFFTLSGSYQPEVNTKLSWDKNYSEYPGENTKEVVYSVPAKLIYGIQFINTTRNTLSYLAFDQGRVQSTALQKVSKNIPTDHNLIKSSLASLNFWKNYGVTYGEREYPLGNIKIKKKFMSMKLNFLGEYRIGLNHFIMTDASGNTSEFKYPEFSYSVKIDVDWLKVKEKKPKTEKEKCEDVFEKNLLTSCDK